MRQIILVALGIAVFVTVASGCELTAGADPAPTSNAPRQSDPTLKPTFTARGTVSTQTPEGPDNDTAPDQEQTGKTSIFVPVVGADEEATVEAQEVRETPTTQAADDSEEEDEKEPLTLRDDLPALSLRGDPVWPRPAGDNGRCMHFVRNQYFTEDVLNRNLPRLQQLGAKWVLVIYADENVLKMAAPRFAQAGIIPVWRKMLRPDEQYFNWKRDVELVQSYGLPPYFQLYNEPSLRAEWGGTPDEKDKEEFLDNLMQATQDVYNAGGYVGWQFINMDWLRDALDELEQRKGTNVLERFFFIPHPYGLNHPPDYTQDENGALGFLFFADIFRNRYGFVPPMIAGEGGWKINNEADARFPKINDQLHRDYHIELFRWFQTGIMSNGQPLPDYLLAYCPWLIAAKGDDNAWWDSFAGDRTLTIEAVSNLPPFERKFSWER